MTSAAERAGADPLDAFVRRMPKVELHVHLEGAISPGTLLALARRRRVTLPADDEETLSSWLASFESFEEFVRIFVVCSRCLRDPEDFLLAVDDFLRWQAADHVLYTEAHCTIGTHAMHGANPGELRDALWEAAESGERRHGVAVRWIPDIVRNVPRMADLTVEWAVAGIEHGVVALGLSGIEPGYPSAPFREHFAWAAESGLHRVAHAGEQAGPESVRETLSALSIDRLGHGIRSLEDSSLVEDLVAARLPLEVCPASNVALGVVPDLGSHPFDALYRRGVAVTVGSDDPLYFGTTLSGEYLALARTFGYSAPELAGLALAALRASFLPKSEREALEGRFRAEVAALGEELFGEPVEPELGDPQRREVPR